MHTIKPSLDENFKFTKSPEVKVNGVNGTTATPRNVGNEWGNSTSDYTAKPKYFANHFADMNGCNGVNNFWPNADTSLSHGLQHQSQNLNGKEAAPVKDNQLLPTYLPEDRHINNFVTPTRTREAWDNSFINTLPPNYLPKLQTEDGKTATLQKTITDKTEENTQLRIKLAVLENDLKHKTTEAEEQVKSISIFFRTLSTQFPALGNTFGTPDGVFEKLKNATAEKIRTPVVNDAKLGKKIMMLEMEVDVLRRENRMLRAQDRDQRLSAQPNLQSHELADGNHKFLAMLGETHEVPDHNLERAIAPTSPHRHENFNHFHQEMEEKLVEEKDIGTSNYQNVSHQQTGQLENDFMDFEQDLTEEHEKQGLYLEDFDSHQEFEAKIRELNGSVLKVKYASKAANVGVSSLEDAILAIDTVENPEQSAVELSGGIVKVDITEQHAVELVAETVKEAPVSRSPAPSLPSENEEMSYNPIPSHLRKDKDHHALLRLNRHPAPTVLKTGFDSEGALCGRDYESCKNALWYRPTVPLFSDNNNIGKVWDSREERINAIENQRLIVGDRAVRFQVGFFKYGVNFTPADGEYKFLETVHIGNLPKNIDTRDLLNRVRGGKVVSAILLNTTNLTGKMSALIRFVNEKAAHKYLSFVESNPVTFGEDDKKLQAEVTLVGTPSYPLSNCLNNAILNLNHTRCICIPYFPNISICSFERDISSVTYHQRGITPTEMWMDEDRTMHLEFAGVSDARMARGKLNAWSMFRGLEVRSEPDPCERPVEELLLDVEPRKPLFPRGGFVDGTTFRQESSGHEKFDNDVARIGDQQRRQFSALLSQKVNIPTFYGTGIVSSSWADEVNDEINLPNTTSTTSIKEENTSVSPSTAAISQNIGSRGKPLTGLAASIYAPKKSHFENRGSAPSTSQSLSNTSKVAKYETKSDAAEYIEHNSMPRVQVSTDSVVRNPKEIACDLGDESMDDEDFVGSAERTESEILTNGEDS
jgi:hypothetical protein